MSLGDSYVVRIFRRAARSGGTRRSRESQSLTGVVENPGTGRRQAFHDIEALWAVLEKSPPAVGGRRKPPRTGK